MTSLFLADASSPGRELRNPVKNNLGWYETIDQIAVAKIWKDRNYVDPTKIGIWGWVGGFRRGARLGALILFCRVMVGSWLLRLPRKMQVFTH